MSYPLKIRFKKIALSRQLSVEDSSGRLLMYVKMKAFKLREAITVFADREQSRALYTIQADRIIDFSANYHIRDMNGTDMGAIQQKGMRSIWRTRFEIARAGNVVFKVEEENPWAKVGDHFLGEIPILGFFTGYLFHPRYLVSTTDGRPVLRLEKKPALLEGLFEFQRIDAPLSEEDERLLLIGSVAVVLLEKNRG
jgi:hypothetical protein